MLTGICKKAIEEERCLGCNKLELQTFVGQATCEYVTTAQDCINHINKILKGDQQRL